MLTDKTITIIDVHFVSDQMVRIQYDNVGDFIDILPNTNVVIAAFTTCYARLKLYSYLEELERNVL